MKKELMFSAKVNARRSGVGKHNVPEGGLSASDFPMCIEGICFEEIVDHTPLGISWLPD